MKSWKEHYWHTVNCSRARIEEIVRRAKASGAKTVLECGCNEGFLSQALIEAGLQVTSIDKDAVQIGKAKELFGIDALQADVAHLNMFKDETFDLVVGGELLEHIDNPGAGLKEMFRVARGRVIISLPIGKYWLGEASHKWMIDASIIEHDLGTIEELAKKIFVIEFIKKDLAA
jgi:2-polyprenyl-3-methyl-5-hydroxy-6-metoxy-1,4-benzoquinol methylase